MAGGIEVTKGMEGVVGRLRRHFDAVDGEREKVFHRARDLRRLSTQAIRAVHKGRIDQAREAVPGLEALSAELSVKEGVFPFVEEALQEYAEMRLLLVFIEGGAFPAPGEIRTTERAFLLGLADCVGELRRHVLRLIREERVEEAAGFVDAMEDVFYALMQFDHPDGVVPVRRKQDQLRPIIERTRAELTMVQSQLRLESRLKKLIPGKKQRTRRRSRFPD
ncbi:MAG: hypothetical protein AB1742_15070 [bacterium]